MASTTDMAPTRSSGSRSSSTKRASTRRNREEQLSDQVQKLQDDLKSITATLTRMADSKVDSVQKMAKREVNHATHVGMNAVDDVQDEFAHLEKQMKDTIRERPLTAVAGAIALGFVLAVVTR